MSPPLDSDFIIVHPDDPTAVATALRAALDAATCPNKQRILRLLIETMPPLTSAIVRERNQGMQYAEVPDTVVSVAMTLLDTMIDLLVDDDRRKRILRTITAATIAQQSAAEMMAAHPGERPN